MLSFLKISVFQLLLLAFAFSYPLIAQAGREVGTALTPRVAYHLEQGKGAMVISVDADALPDGGQPPVVHLGATDGKRLFFLSNPQARVSVKDQRYSHQFTLPWPKGGEALALAFTVEWPGGPDGKPWLSQRFLHTGPGAVHRPLSKNAREWTVINLKEYAQESEERRLEVAFTFNQPVNGKATVVIEDEKGQRVRNLMAAHPMRQGEHRLVWDGADDDGTVVAPGRYQWRSISHPGLSPVFQTEFLNAPGSNHGTFHTAAYNGKSLFLAASVAEGGHELVELDPHGKFIRGVNPPHGHGLSHVFIAADERFVYMIHEGRGWSDGRVDRSKPDWKASHRITFAKVDLETGRAVPLDGRSPYQTVINYEVGPGSPGARRELGDRARGVALFGGKLYLGDHDKGEVVILSTKDGKEEGRFPLVDPVSLAADGEHLYAISGDRLVRVDPQNGKTTSIAKLAGKPVTLAVGDGRFFVADRETHQVHVYTQKGKLERSIGKAGGLVVGAYDPLMLQNPKGLVVVGDELWVTEHDRWQPKRFAAYDIKTGQVAREFFGPTSYGSPGGGFDPLDHESWIGQDTFFEVDFATGKSKPLRVMDIIGKDRLFSIRRHQYWRQDGRTFLISTGKATYIQEIMPDGLVRRLAMISSAHQFAYSFRWDPPQSFIDAFTKAWPDAKVAREEQNGKMLFKPHHGYGMMWMDLNGDGEFQEEEFNFSTDAESFGGSGWSHDFHDLTLRILARVAGETRLVTLKPDGYFENGVPRYAMLNEALKSAVAVDLEGNRTAEVSAVDRFGNLIVGATPKMASFAPDGRRLWSYPNLWNNVHGSHRAPLPEPGQLQGVLFFSGVAPLDETSDVFFLNGNHGQGFVMTGDGLYVDAVFPDVRTMTNPFASGVGILGGECFGGTFGRSEKDGNFYFQGGGLSYRIYRIEGLREIQRQAGNLEVSAEQVLAAERRAQRAQAEVASVLEIDIPEVTTPSAKTLPKVAEWRKNGQYPVVLHAGRDAENLYLFYRVQDASPWVNNGKDWQALFKTGDGVDLQLGTNPMANPRRLGAAPGDLRLFMAPMGQENVAVLYRHRVPDVDPAESVEFQSPWRSEKVDQVQRLDGVKMSVSVRNDWYELYAVVPLEALGIASLDRLELRGDFGVIYGDAAGTVNLFRHYWSNQATGLVNDVPGEIMLTPAQWSPVRFAPIPSTK